MFLKKVECLGFRRGVTNIPCCDWNKIQNTFSIPIFFFFLISKLYFEKSVRKSQK